jgi:hypothetical protein
MNGFGGLLFALVLLFIVVIFGLLIAGMINGIREWHSNNQQPIQTLHAVVIGKRLDISGGGTNSRCMVFGHRKLTLIRGTIIVAFVFYGMFVADGGDVHAISGPHDGFSTCLSSGGPTWQLVPGSDHPAVAQRGYWRSMDASVRYRPQSTHRSAGRTRAA